MELLKRLSEMPGVSGREEPVRRFISGELDRLTGKVETDNLGNLISFKRGSGKRRVMLSAHMDEIGFLVSHIDENGFVRIVPVGYFNPRSLFAQRVVAYGEKNLPGVLALGTKPIHMLDPEEANTLPKVSDYFVDLGLSKEKARELVSIGDPIAMQREFTEFGDLVTGKALDDRVGVYVMLKSLERLERQEADIFAVASVQEEVGLRGAAVAAFSVEPDIAIAIDITDANDFPGFEEQERCTTLGKGVAIKVMDGDSISNQLLMQKLRAVADQHGIPHQPELLPDGGTDAAAMQSARAGSAAVTLSLPTRHFHTVVETCHKDDIEAAITLLVKFLEVAHEGDFSQAF
ncbi:MAG: M42 family metallopeptidase [Chloroflexi bacterium]|nr:M42 family metallopeptidase [Chloroflexota bacterium]